MARAYRCSECAHLYDMDEYCSCFIGIDPRPNHREHGDAKECRRNFEQLPPERQWHEKFSWER